MWLFRRLLSSTGAKTAYVIAVAWLVYRAWMAFEAPRRIAPGVLERAEREGRIAVSVQLPFPPERFHVLKVQDVGRVRRVIGNTIEVRAIDATGIRGLARKYYWIEEIRPADPPR